MNRFVDFQEETTKSAERPVEEKYYVVGGEYLDPQHRQLKPGSREQYGPFVSYADALRKWRERAWATIDDTYCRFTILSEGELAGGSADRK